MQSNGTLSLIMPCFASEVRTPTDGHRWCHSPCVFVFVWAAESLWVVTPPHLCSHLASGRWFCPQHELGNMLSERTKYLTNPFLVGIAFGVLCGVSC